METHRRSIAKSLTWRVVAFFITAGTTWTLTGQIELALSVGAADLALKLGSFYLHERAWNRSKFGRVQEQIIA